MGEWEDRWMDFWMVERRIQRQTDAGMNGWMMDEPVGMKGECWGERMGE